ncbi:dnaJ homolog subfamily B member 9 isoform X1 [Erpetoichthys calabaricus]|nr:dnaJ homolog subfamily B member 9 isoform X1 [Erpetoichthys calabaricus]
MICQLPTRCSKPLKLSPAFLHPVLCLAMKDPLLIPQLALLWLLLLLDPMLAVKDYYDILGMSPSATGQQIKKAFHRLAMKYHPDKNRSPGAERKFREIAEAYEVLSNEAKRQEYDDLGHQGFVHVDRDMDVDMQFFTFVFNDLHQHYDFDTDGFYPEEEVQLNWEFLAQPEGVEDEEFLGESLEEEDDRGSFYVFGKEFDDLAAEFV